MNNKCSICGANIRLKWHKAEDCVRTLEVQNVELRSRVKELEDALTKIVDCQDRWTESDVIVREMVDIAKGALR